MKNVVIVGAASAGGQLARALVKTLPDDHRIVLIDANEFAFWPVGALRAAVVPGFEREIFASFDNFFPADSRHIFLAGYAVEQITPTSIKLAKHAPAPFDSDTIQVDIGVIATGSTYASPMRPASAKLDEAVAAIQDMQTQIKQANNIVVLGGGAVGVEFVGEVVSQHPDKRITLIQKDAQLLPGWRKALHSTLLAQLKSKNVDVRLNTSLDVSQELRQSSNRLLSSPQTLQLSDGTQIKTDFLFIGTGATPNVKAVPKEALSQQQHDKLAKPPAVHVDPVTLRVAYEPMNKRWFCLGDASDVPGAGTHVSATSQSATVAAHVAAQADNKGKKAKAYGGSPGVMAVPIGPKAGAVQLFYPVFGEWITTLVKSKNLFVSDFISRHPGGMPLKAGDEK